MLRWLRQSLFCHVTHYESVDNNGVVASLVVESAAELAICDSKSRGGFGGGGTSESDPFFQSAAIVRGGGSE